MERITENLIQGQPKKNSDKLDRFYVARQSQGKRDLFELVKGKYIYRLGVERRKPLGELNFSAQ